jgi:hypothetical protein
MDMAVHIQPEEAYSCIEISYFAPSVFGYIYSETRAHPSIDDGNTFRCPACRTGVFLNTHLSAGEVMFLV